VRQRLRWLCVLPAFAFLTPVPTAAATTTTSSSFATAMQQAADSRLVPLAVIEATAYVNTRWEWINSPGIDGAIGPMRVTPSQMALASSLSGHSAADIEGDLGSNLDAGAALIAHYHTSGSDLASWQTAVATTQGPLVARDIFDVIRAGASRTTSTGEAISLAPQTVAAPTTGGASSVDSSATATTTASPDYPAASWIPADSSNFTVANRPIDYPIDMVVIHDIEGSASSAIQAFQNPDRDASAHYVVDYNGAITQMVLEKDIAWHAGNWDYNTRAIGIEHAGFASTNLYTTAEYNASARLLANICSKYGLVLNRTNVIAHAEVPDPFHPGEFGGDSHHWDPGPYWNWTYYMNQARSYAGALPSPPHMFVKPTITPIDGGLTIGLTGRTCHLPIAGYQVVVNPGNIVLDVAGSATSATVSGLHNGTAYTITVTATNADGQDSNSTTGIPSPPCTAPTLRASPVSSGPTGGSITFTGSAKTCTNPTYKFWVQPPGGAWHVARWYSTSSTFTWRDTGIAGTYRIEVDVRQQTSSVAYDAVANIYYTLVGCSAAGLATDAPSPQPPGTTVVISGSSTCPGPPEYRFWIRPPGGAWSIVQDYGVGTSYGWNTTGKAQGTYALEVDVRDQGSEVPYEAVANASYVLGPATCHNATLSASPATGAAGATTTFTGGSTGCPNPLYRFWIAPPGGGWSIVRNYSSSNTFTWPAALTPGTYRFEVDVRDQSSPASYDTVKTINYVVVGCTAGRISTDKASPQLTGTASVIVTGSASCPGTPEYRFWVRDPGSRWSMVQNYGASSTYNWNTSRLAPGTYSLEVDVRDRGSSAAYETVATTTFTLGRCISASMTPDKASPQPVGTTITFTGSATCVGTPQYRFWVKAPGGAWTIAQDYGSSNTFAWNTAGNSAGTYQLEVDVRNAGSTAIYEAVSNSTYVLS
jgi:N-acetylmuramoyl-L-alanine amidase/Y_Y_Y domain